MADGSGWGLVAAIMGAMVLVTAVGSIVAFRIVYEESDADCKVNGEHDERDSSCREICKTGPAWFVWGEAEFCYWDDNETRSS